MVEQEGSRYPQTNVGGSLSESNEETNFQISEKTGGTAASFLFNLSGALMTARAAEPIGLRSEGK